MPPYESLIADLEQAIATGDAEGRMKRLWLITDLFITQAGRYSDAQVTLFDEVIGRLAAEIEVKARAKLATRLAAVAGAPPRVMRTLAADEDAEVAAPVLAQSDCLREQDLVDTARKSSQEHLLAISHRPELSEPVTDVLVDRGNTQVVRSVSKNGGARFSDAGFGVLVKRSARDDVLAERVGTRPDIPRHHFLKLIANASDTVRGKLAAAHPEAASDIRQVLADVVGKIRAEAVTSSAQYDAAKKAVAARARSGPLGEAEVYEYAKARKFEETAVAFAQICGVPTEVVETALLDERPDMLLILSRTAGLSWSVVKAILLLHSQRGMSALDLEQALMSYERLTAATACKMVEFYRRRRAAIAQAVP
jgi:uncharacterized protein (DUF2336 family)